MMSEWRAKTKNGRRSERSRSASHSDLLNSFHLGSQKPLQSGEMSPGSSTESYPAFARIGLRENPGKNLNQVTCLDRDSNPGYLVSRPDALTNVYNDIVQQIHKVDRINKVDRIDKIDRIVEADLIEKVDRIDKVDRVDKIHKVDRIDKIDRIDKVDRIDKIDRIVEADLIENVDRIDKVDRVDKVGRIDKINPMDKIDPMDKIAQIR
ncbi:hypothetical protein ANN_13588 [Periplaneta americana]|uniref:Uncharacterized protein n=1 Tax=Periplaneta americana TaxID=6978 RepID=A0ABQ8TKU6_PERAM|nr:hypothetical protein ANN_13588 [Periplaneta americana]